MVADTGRYGGRGDLFQAEIPRSRPRTWGCGRSSWPSPRAGPVRRSVGRVAVLRHTVPITPGLRSLERDVFGGSFELRSDGAGADLPPGEAGLLLLPRVADGRHAGYVDLCFSRFEAQADRSAPRETPGFRSCSARGRPISR